MNRQLLNFIEVYEQTGWVFSSFVSLQLSLWHLDPLRASAFVPLPNWIQMRRAVVNIRGTGNDCFQWVVLAGMHPVDANAHRMSQHTEHVAKYDFSSLHFPVPLSSVGSFVTANNMSHVFQEHIPCIFAYKVVSSVDPNFSRPLVMYRGENAAEKSVRDLQ